LLEVSYWQHDRKTWRGIVRKERADEYIAHLKEETFRELGGINGFISAKILKRNTKEGIEFLVVTVWKDDDAIRQFAGSNIQTAVVPERVRDMMITYDKPVVHYIVNFETSE
jgi:heme-degrading monooxygenase HmoA